MKNKKAKPVKAGSNRRKVLSDVSPSTSLPPLVEGQLRCFLRVTVSRVLWTITKPPSETLVRLRWWGESSSGTLFRPRDGSHVGQKGVKSTTRFPVRCGPKQFTSYLTDMGSLILDVLTKPDHLPIARVQISGIARLSLTHSISGFFTLISPTSEKLGELQVTLALEALAETYDSSSSVPTTDVSIDTAMSAPAFASKASSDPSALVVPPLPRHLLANIGKESVGSSSGNTPRGKDHLYFQEKSTVRVSGGPGVGVEAVIPTPTGTQPVDTRSANSHTSVDLLSVLLERGSKLRNAMVVSALKTDLDSETALKDTSVPLPRDNAGPPPLLPPAPSSGKLLENILYSDPDPLNSSHRPMSPNYLSAEYTADTENRAVDLLLGSGNGSVLPLWDGEGSPPESLSSHSSLCVDSELNDPQYDQSLLENLFYKTPEPDGSFSVSGDTAEKEETLKRKSGEKAEPKQTGRSPGKSVRTLDPAGEKLSDQRDILPGLSADRVTVLEGIRAVRVIILSLTVPTDSRSATPTKLSVRGKPPRPLTTRRCSYFIEYLFPLASIGHGNSRAAEVTRIVSSKVTGGEVKFQQRNIFPVHFDIPTIKRWWDAELTLKIYCRKSSQKKPVPVGIAVFPLRSILQSERLSLTTALSVQRLGLDTGRQGLGPLKVSIELATDKKDFSAKTRSAGGFKAGQSSDTHSQEGTAPSQSDVSFRPQIADPVSSNAPGLTNGYSRRDRRDVSPVGIRSAQNVPTSRPWPMPSQAGLQTSLNKPPPQQPPDDKEEDTVLLHALLMVPDGKDFNCGPGQQPNVYLNCKLFGSDETTRSVVSWGQTNPSFNLVQVAPVALGSRLLERMRNNVMVIEVWQKVGSSGNDKLLGLVKLPLHQFYISFRDPRISHLLLQAQYPVIGVDSYLPVIDVFSGNTHGSLRVCLAMGLTQQILALQRMRGEELGFAPQIPRPVHLLDHRPHADRGGSDADVEAMNEHVFLVRVERVKGLTPLQSTVWGEADCYVQYSFPTQEEEPKQNVDPNIIESSVSLKQFRTAATLCVPDPVFGHSEKHVLLVPVGIPVQRLLLSSLASQGLKNGGGVQFEVWCRYYYPNVRDQLVAKGMLPLSKLCAMVTMQRQGQTDSQHFSLPLVSRMDSPAEQQFQPSGLLEVSVQCKCRTLRTDGVRGGAVATRAVTLVVQVHRAAGLKAAARTLAGADDGFQYYADVGVNSFVSMQLSFLPESEKRNTRVAARAFCPEFDHHTEFTCNLLMQRDTGETLSLAELLQEAVAVFTVYNRDSRKAVDVARRKDTVLGMVKIKLADLIHKRTGVSGWYGLSLPPDMVSSCESYTSVGGLEVSISFAHPADRERVISAARGLGWEVERQSEDEDEDDEDETEEIRPLAVSVSMPRAWLPIPCLLLPGHSELRRSTYCYYRYKLYDSEAFCSSLRHPGLDEEREDSVATVAFQGSNSVELRWSQPLRWYLREEKLEVQMWVAFGKEKRARPHDSDRLVGSAFVDLSSLAKTSKHKQTISGVYPLFKRSAADLCGAALRVHITVTAGSLPLEPAVVEDSEEELAMSPGEEEETRSPATASRQTRALSRHQTKSTAGPELPPPGNPELSEEDTFSVSITVDRAMHLSLKGCPLAERSGGLPCCCVSYATADAFGTVSTAVVQDSNCPVWDHQQECRLSKQLLLDPQQCLVFKVWHKGEVERVIGFVSVDLSPLLSGFQSVCGWYNITDFSGQCQGQLKVSVTPLMGVQELRSQRKAAWEEPTRDSSALFRSMPLLYQTSGLYSSFPSHISQFPEQRINTSPDHLDRQLTDRSSVSDRYDEHLDNVRLFHQSLQEGERDPRPGSTGDSRPSSSALFSALRKNLSELDDIQRYFSRKLSTPTFPVLGEQGQVSRLGEHRDSESDTAQLLLKSNQLVGEVNNIIKGLSEHQTDRTEMSWSSIPEEPDLSGLDHRPPRGPENSETALLSHRESETGQEDISPISSPPPQEQSHSPVSDKDVLQDFDAPISSEDENEHKEEDREEEEGVDEGEVEEFEETLIEPRPLNEVTSITDRTSPWTSVMSDPDLGSLESLEAVVEQPARDYSYPMQVETRNVRESLEIVNPQALTSDSMQRGGAGGTTLSDESDSGESDMARDSESMIENQEEDEHKSIALHEDSSLESPGRDHYTRMSDSEDENEQGAASVLSSSDPVELPNFFLPSHQLEASMRALRLAPVFPSGPSDPENVRHGIPYRRVTRQRPVVPPSSVKKEETKRIAKIFASNFKEDR
ncbi:C2 domain-containing protein 3 [Chanos chanos]|uniref:C2 domain-containing protein 3 n=1 Tax=Chanos chanos TaxID=29144 RepID=A0A6J2VPB5_CHACN|nr:C2 domain-containing protein 3 [Chanos chanos]